MFLVLLRPAGRPIDRSSAPIIPRSAVTIIADEKGCRLVLCPCFLCPRLCSGFLRMGLLEIPLTDRRSRSGDAHIDSSPYRWLILKGIVTVLLPSFFPPSDFYCPGTGLGARQREVSVSPRLLTQTYRLKYATCRGVEDS